MSDAVWFTKLSDKKCTFNAGMFEWKPCYKSTVTLVWGVDEFADCPAMRWVWGNQLCNEHFVARMDVAKIRNQRVVEVK